jgi:RNase adaptor protein for sRNA GlmZ degradation
MQVFNETNIFIPKLIDQHMAEYVLQDKDKAAFINKMNKVLSQLQPGLGVDNTSFIDVPENKDEDKTIFVTGDPVEEKVLDQLISQKAFIFKVKKISLKEILKEIKQQINKQTQQ